MPERTDSTSVCRELLLTLALTAVCGLAQAQAPAAAAPAGAPPVVAAPSVAPAAVPAAGRHAARVTVSQFGRYAVSVTSPQGTRIELVDRVAGSLGADGEAGSADGRLDLFLDRGEYQVIVNGDERSKGSAALHVEASREIAAPPGPLLTELKPVALSLEDHQQASWWLRIAERRTVFLEAAGRDLRDLRLWRDGTWLEDAAPRCGLRQPVVGQPVLDCQLAVTLEPGLLRLTAYGGKAQPWAEAEGGDSGQAHPLFLRWGIPTLPDSGRRRFVISPFGSDRYLAPPAANFFRIELPGSGTASLRAGNVLRRDPYFKHVKIDADITKQSRPPAVEVLVPEVTDQDRRWHEETASEPAPESASSEEDVTDDSTPATDESSEDVSADQGEGQQDESTDEATTEESSDDSSRSAGDSAETEPAESNLPKERWIEVSGAPGQAYVLQHFELRDVYTFEHDGRYWLSTVQTGSAGDEADATALLITARQVKSARRLELVGSAALELGAQQAFARRFNLLDDVTLFFRVTEAGSYQIVSRGAVARFRFEPYFATPPRDYKTPPLRASGEAWALDPGVYVLTIHPENKGVLDVAIRQAGGTPADAAQALEPLASSPPDPKTAPRGEARFGALNLQTGEGYTLISGLRPGVRTGVVLRRLPLDLTAALPLALRPGETVTIEGDAPVAGVLRAEAEDGSLLPIAVDGAAAATEPEVAPGRHSVAVSHSSSATAGGARTVSASLLLVPANLRPHVIDEPLPQADLDSLPRFTTLTPGQPLRFDLTAGQRSTYLVHADQPALYEVASTGLLTVTGNMRTRTITSLANGDANGVGQNFALRPYLGVGEYQLTVATRGASAGHLGLMLRQTELRDGGVLRSGIPGRATLAAGEGIAFRFSISEAGQYRLQGMGEGYTYRCRLEDADGWPVTRPDTDADLKLRLLPGSYRLVLLPRATPAKAVALVEKIEKAKVGKGHGPEALALGKAVSHVWSEPASGDQRPSDLYAFHLAAKAHVRVVLDNEMQGHLSRQGDTTAQAALFVPPGRGWSGELEAGDYALAVECSRRNNLVTYAVSVTPEELVAGTERSVEAPGEVAVAIGDTGMTEIESHASSPVRAVLLDADGNTVARAAARPDDWNFLFSGHVAPGRYRLRVEPIATPALRVGLVMRSRVEIEEHPVTLPLDRQLDPGEAVHVLPLEIPRGAELLAVTLASRENVGCALERREGEAWRLLASAVGRSPRVAVALDPAHALPVRLRVWSIDGRGEALRAQAAAAGARHLREADLRSGIALAALKGFAPPLGGAIVDLDRLGVLRHRALADGLLQAGAAGQALTPSEDGQLVALGRRVFLLGDVGTRVQAERVTLGSVAPKSRGAKSDAGKSAAPATPGTGLMLVKVRVPEAGRVAVDLAGAGGPLVATVRSLSFQPGVRAGAADTASGEAMATGAAGAGSAVSVALRSSTPAVLLWNAGGDAAGDAELSVSMPQVLAGETAGFGVREGVLSGDTALPLALPAGRKRVVLTLGEHTVAAFADGDQVRSVHWQGGEAFEQSLTSDATRLVMLHAGGEPTPYRVELLPDAGTGGDSSLRAGSPFERAFDRSGSLRLRVEVPAAGDGSVHVRGAEGAPVFVTDDGRVVRGADLQPRAAGTLTVRHGPGVAVAWVDAGGKRASPWPQEGLAPVPQAAPAVLPLGATNLRLHVPLGPAQVLQLRTAVPVATVVARAAGAEVEIHPAGARLHALAEGDGVDVLLHGLGGATLSGVAELTTTPVLPLKEGLNAPLLLAGGDRAYFAFEIGERRRIGVGVRADGSAVECELLTAAGHSLGRGVLQLLDLEPGRYLLSLGLPPDAAPATARPVIVGLDVPSTGPPPDVIRSYLQTLTQTTVGTGGEQ